VKPLDIKSGARKRCSQWYQQWQLLLDIQPAYPKAKSGRNFVKIELTPDLNIPQVDVHPLKRLLPPDG
jgi:hypothetical protein